MDVLAPAAPNAIQPQDGAGCHAGAQEMHRAAAAAGKSETLERYAADYPKGPHDQPQSMCPAFGSLRVGLRMRRTATILSGSACCVKPPRPDGVDKDWIRRPPSGCRLLSHLCLS